MSVDARYFEVFYQQPDPWGYRTRWYEQRKRALLLAALHRPRYRRGLELGCSTGETTAALAPRCAELVATDANAVAVEHARRRMDNASEVRVLCMRHPEQWPQPPFDLVVFSELGYYLDADDLDATLRLVIDSLDRDALVLACHWRRPIPGFPWTGDEVHARMHRLLPLTRIFRHEEQDMLIDGWTRDGRSVACSEGIA